MRSGANMQDNALEMLRMNPLAALYAADAGINIRMADISDFHRMSCLFSAFSWRSCGARAHHLPLIAAAIRRRLHFQQGIVPTAEKNLLPTAYH